MTASTVFIVDDDAAVRDSLAMLLELKGFHTRTYTSAEEFLERYRSDWAGCLVLDLRMTGMSGLELQAELLRRGIGLPVIIATAHGTGFTPRVPPMVSGAGLSVSAGRVCRAAVTASATSAASERPAAALRNGVNPNDTCTVCVPAGRAKAIKPA